MHPLGGPPETQPVRPSGDTVQSSGGTPIYDGDFPASSAPEAWAEIVRDAIVNALNDYNDGTNEDVIRLGPADAADLNFTLVPWGDADVDATRLTYDAARVANPNSVSRSKAASRAGRRSTSFPSPARRCRWVWAWRGRTSCAVEAEGKMTRTGYRRPS